MIPATGAARTATTAPVTATPPGGNGLRVWNPVVRPARSITSDSAGRS
ncbi:hypothetical protein [Actinokineospora spheciospongiae]|nr:hypothetical protein [Actinokineospora spheciospongiae]PWW59596.1 hypothetical protein DFQ13_108233 [Actinokineospora spheciospongiae]